jgi:hypothetical protein
MGFVDLVFCPLAIICAVIVVYKRTGKFRIFGVLSFVFATLPPLLSVYDILDRVGNGDTAGVLDIYPTVLIIYAVVIVVVIALNLCSIFIKPNSK